MSASACESRPLKSGRSVMLWISSGRRTLALSLVLLAILGTSLRAETYEVALENALQQISWQLQSREITEVSPILRPLPDNPGGGRNGFLEACKEFLKPLGVRIRGGSRHRIVVQMLTADEARSVRLVASLFDGQEEIASTRENPPPLIDDGASIAEISGRTAFFPPAKIRNIGFNPDRDQSITSADWGRLRRDAIGDQLKNPVAFRTEADDFIFSDEAPSYGIGIRVNGQVRRFEYAEGESFTRLGQGEQYEIVLFNGTLKEVAVNLKIDGVNVFHFSDPLYRRSDGGKYKYFVVPPQSERSVQGWVKNDQRRLRFRITPPEEGAAAQAGISQEDVGLVTATFHASWERQESMPRDEPRLERTITVKGPQPVVETIEQTYTVIINGRPETRTRQVQVQKSVNYSQEVATGFGDEVFVSASGVNRTIGTARATIAFRYYGRP